MEVIHVPRPSKKAMNPERPANALLLSQVSHLQHAERRLPLRYRPRSIPMPSRPRAKRLSTFAK